MTESQYNAFDIIPLSNIHTLVVHIISHETYRSVPVRLIDLFFSERRMDGGRFLNYDKLVDTNPAMIKMKNNNLTIGFKNSLEWIAENICGKWAFHLYLDELLCIYQIYFYFSDPVDSMIFKLSVNNE